MRGASVCGRCWSSSRSDLRCPGTRRRSNASRCGTASTAICPDASTAPAAGCSSRFGGCGWRRFSSSSSSGGLALRAPPAAGLFGTLIIAVGAPSATRSTRRANGGGGLSGIRFGEVRFESKLPTSALFGLYWIGHRLELADSVRAVPVGRWHLRHRLFNGRRAKCGLRSVCDALPEPRRARAHCRGRIGLSSLAPWHSAWSCGYIFAAIYGRRLLRRRWSTIWRRPTTWPPAATR